MMVKRLVSIVIFITVLFYADAFGLERFPPPEFDDHQLPETTVPGARDGVLEYIDAAVLLVALISGAYLVLKKRSRKWIFVLMLFSLVYFGFYRKGCVCSIGAIGNVSLALFNSDYAIPIAALVFFVLPLVFSLFFGRVFCGAVCPLGAIQDAVLLKPVAIPGWFERSLRIIAYLYLGLAVLFAATGSGFIICRYDPFVGFFRMNAPVNMFVSGVVFLIVGMFIGRPYCRFFCAYGVLLRLCSRFSKYKLTITPDDCISCGLCEDACPFGAIDKPTVDWTAESHSKAKKRMVWLLVLLPVLVAVGCLIGYGVYTSVEAEENFLVGSIICGGFIGFVIGVKLVYESIRFRRSEYTASKANCFSCGRCFKYCPKEQQRLKETVKMA